jgi:four helix bundle protein
VLKLTFYETAKGSLAEFRTQIDIACQVGYIDEKVFVDVEEKATQIGKMLGALIKSRTQVKSFSTHP